MMERVVVLGPGGAGKSELAAELSRRTGIPVVHLDRLFWGPGWAPVPSEQARRSLATAATGERWILDGNFLAADGGNGRFKRADTVVFLDLPRRTCIRRVLWRLVRDRRRSRPDLPLGCGEGLDLRFLRWIWRYPRDDRPRVLELLAGLEPQVDIRHIRSAAEARRYVRSIER